MGVNTIINLLLILFDVKQLMCKAFNLLLSDPDLFNTFNIFFLSYLKDDLTSGLSWSGSHGSWIYNYLCNQCIMC